MKRKAAVLFLLTLLFLTFYINKLFELEYDVNILQYIQYDADYTKAEREVLERYNPLIYSGNINEPPLGIYYKEYNQYTGIVVDYINALSIELGTPIMSRPMIWNQALEELKDGKTNLCDMIPSKEREKYYAFSNPLYNLRGIVTLKKESDIEKINDLKGKKIAVQKGDYVIDSIKNIGGILIVETDNLEEALKLLSNDQVDATAGDEPVIRYYLNELSDAHDYRILEKPLYESYCVVAVPRNQSELIPIFNKAILGMRQKGILDKIEKKWAGPYTGYFSKDIGPEKQQLRMMLILFLAMLLAYIIYLWNRSLKLLVDSRTKELSFMKNELQITFDGIEDFLAVISKDLRIKNINQSFLEYLKWEKNKVLDVFYTDIPILYEFEKEQNNLIRSILSSGQQFSAYNSKLRYELKRKGKLFRLAIYPLPIETTDQVSLLVMISDITLARIKEQELYQSNKMDTIGHLAAGVAHELKNPLGIIRNSSFILHDDMENNAPYNLMALDAIDHSVTRASSIIDNLLKYSRLTPEGKRLVNVQKSIQDALELSNKRISDQHITVEINCDDSVVLFMNHESLEHILLNLIQNSLDAMPDGGELTISGTSLSNFVQIKVQDTGTGIPEKDLSMIFDPFYTTKPLGKGTGLGLYIVYSEVEKAHGEIRAESEKNKGTMFIVTIPKEGEKAWQAD